MSKSKNFAFVRKLRNGNLLHCANCLHFYGCIPSAMTKTSILFVFRESWTHTHTLSVFLMFCICLNKLSTHFVYKNKYWKMDRKMEIKGNGFFPLIQFSFFFIKNVSFRPKIIFTENCFFNDKCLYPSWFVLSRAQKITK